MIKFFRRIRYDLMEKNKTGKPALSAGRYLKYAIGEIFLVVIGILIALGVNNWNEGNKSKEEEREYLINLLGEFKANQEQLNKNITVHKSIKLNTKELSDIINPNPKEISSGKFDTLMWSMALIPEFKALNSMVLSGKLEIVNDYELKNEISNWRLTYELYSYSLKITYDQFNSHIYPFLTNNYLLKNAKGYLIQDDKSHFEVNQKSILSNPIFENQVKLRNINAELIFERATKLFEIQENIIKSIELKLQS